MDEYIKKETAIKSLLNDCLGQVSYSREDAADCIFWLDTADVAPVRHGRWITKQEKDTFAGYLYSYECSECGRVEQCKEPYCNCGAKMDLED